MNVIRLAAVLVAAFVMLALPEAAHAAWHKAESDHFVIYADDSEKDIRRFAENLERYHKAMEIVTGRVVPPPSPSNRVTIFVVGDQRDLRRTLGTDSRSIGGIYIPRAGASRAFVQDIRNRSGGYPHFSTVILLHEYAHHFLWSSSRFAMPRWMSEGAAEFFASATFEKDGSLSIGLPARHRSGELYFAEPVSVRELLDPDLYRENRGRRYDAFYGRSWLLYHYLSFSRTRTGQLNRYWAELQRGTSSPDAGAEVFGDLNQLEIELDTYVQSRRLDAYKIAAEHLQIGAVRIERLSRGEARAMEVRMTSQAGVTREAALELLEDARKVAADYPDDPGVLTALAEAEYDAGNDDRAIAAADAALALDPSRTNAYVQKGYALFRRAAEAGDEALQAAAYADAMRPFEALNALENDHPIPLMYYHRSFAERGVEPDETARAALERAAQLAPFDQSLWLQVALMQAGEGKIELARQSLRPLAANPHGGRSASAAGLLMDLLEEAPEGEPIRIDTSFVDVDEEETEEPDEDGDEDADAVADTGEEAELHSPAPAS